MHRQLGTHLAIRQVTVGVTLNLMVILSLAWTTTFLVATLGALPVIHHYTAPTDQHCHALDLTLNWLGGPMTWTTITRWPICGHVTRVSSGDRTGHMAGPTLSILRED